ncbi:MAG: hypothetical protein ACXWWY_11905, partial [Candidatus Deferrimicrobiaceae bacterium]
MARRAMDPHGCAPVSRGPFPEDPGIRGPLHPLRLRCPPSPYRRGYASVERLAGSRASTLSVHGLFGNGPLEAGAQPCGSTARRATNGAPSEAAEQIKGALQTGRPTLVH